MTQTIPKKTTSTNPKIHFIMTGGTIDSYYEGTKDTVVPNKHSSLPTYIRGLKLSIETEFTEVCMKDSRDLSLEDMKSVKETIEKSKDKYFIITSGTYCMPDTARFLEGNLKDITQKVVIFTGSMIPLTGFTNSDASFNLGFSMAKIFNLKPGIYVCMNGSIFDPGEIAKLVSQGRFISIYTK